MALSFEQIEVNLDKALAFASNWHAACLAATPKERRLLKQAIFTRLEITEEGQVRHEVAEAFTQLLGDELQRAATRRHHQLTKVESDQMDAARAELSARLAGSFNEPVKEPGNDETPDTEGIEGSNALMLVGVEGLEPTTASL